MVKYTILKYLAYLLVIANIKSVPFSFHLRFYYLVAKHFFWRRKIKPTKLFKANEYHTHTPLMEMDMNLHKNNSTYFSDLDMSRADLFLDLFKDFFIQYRLKKGAWPFCPLGSVMTIFKKEITVYRPYTVRSRVLGWDHKWLFVLSKFQFNDAQKTTAAVSLSKYVLKYNRKTIPPEEAIQMIGLDSEENLERGRMDFEKAKAMLEIESLQDEVV